MAKTRRRPAYVRHEDVMARELKNAEFRYHYEQRRLAHELAIVVRNMRKAAGYTQAGLAKRIGVSQPMIAKIEKGVDQTQPHWQALHRIVVALGGQLKLTLSTRAEEDGALVELDGRPIDRSAASSAEID